MRARKIRARRTKRERGNKRGAKQTDTYRHTVIVFSKREEEVIDAHFSV